MEWFRKEASVRDVTSTAFRVDPYIRRMLLQHHANLIGPDEQQKLIEQGQLVTASPTSQTS
jgi:hypothetical protein